MILKTCGPQHLTGAKYKPRFVQTTTKSLSQSEARQPGPPVVRSTPDALVACDDLIHNRKSFKHQARMHVATLIQRTTSSAFEVKNIANHRYTVLLSYISAYFICYVYGEEDSQRAWSCDHKYPTRGVLPDVKMASI